MRIEAENWKMSTINRKTKLENFNNEIQNQII